MVSVYQVLFAEKLAQESVISININLQLLVPEAICCCLQTCNSCMLIVMVGIALVQSFIVVGITTSL